MTGPVPDPGAVVPGPGAVAPDPGAVEGDDGRVALGAGPVATALAARCAEGIWAAIDEDPETEIIVDVARGIVEVPAIGMVEPFPLDESTRHRFLNGLDDIGITLGHGAAIDDFEDGRPGWLRTS